jgi:hypothetical protein
MTTVNYSIPDDVKELFNTAFAGANRSEVVAGLMQQAAEHECVLNTTENPLMPCLQNMLQRPRCQWTPFMLHEKRCGSAGPDRTGKGRSTHLETAGIRSYRSVRK